MSLPSDQNNKSEDASPNNLISELETTFKCVVNFLPTPRMNAIIREIHF